MQPNLKTEIILEMAELAAIGGFLWMIVTFASHADRAAALGALV